MKRILVGPLDWGLGHVSRCVPLIRYIRNAGHEVVFAGNYDQQEYIRVVFPDMECVFLEGYNVRYARTRKGFMGRILVQLPRIRQRIREEETWLAGIIARQQIDAVISDNRYGLVHPKIPCVLMTHQLQVLSGWGMAADRLLQKIHYRFITRFRECWVVDQEKVPGLSGKLAHPDLLPHLPVRYLGLLSQCSILRSKRNGYLLVLLSGTEPQRSLLSALLWKQVQALQQPVVFIEGSAAAATPGGIPPHIRYYKRVAGDLLQDLLAGASLVVCRSGYSSLMDLAALQQKAILIPTPGQTEQEYLARHMQEQGMQLHAAQEGFDISAQLVLADGFPYRPMPGPDSFNAYAAVLDHWLSQ